MRVVEEQHPSLFLLFYSPITEDSRQGVDSPKLFCRVMVSFQYGLAIFGGGGFLTHLLICLQSHESMTRRVIDLLTLINTNGYEVNIAALFFLIALRDI